MQKNNPTTIYLSELYERALDKHELYYDLLVKEREAIDANKIENLEEYSNIERALMAEIGVLKKCIDAIESQADSTEDASTLRILELKTQTGDIRDKALALNAENRYIIESKMATIREDLKSIRSKIGSASPYHKIGNPNIIDISR